MRDGHDPSIQRLPIWARSTVRARGEHETSLRIFCPDRKVSVPFGVCARCPKCVVVSDGDSATIACRPNTPAAMPQARVDVAEAAARARVADIVSPKFCCAKPDVTAAIIQSLAAIEGTRIVPIVGDDGVLLGVVSPRSAEAQPRWARAEQFMDHAPETIYEHDPLTNAIAKLALAHRDLPVVSVEGVVVGVLCAEDVTRWLARALGYTLE
jgi:CBS-domain-containing membrane protein